MPASKAFAALRSMEALAARDTCLHRLPASLKIAGTLGYILVVVSFPAYAFSGLVPFLAYPILAAAIARMPWRLLCLRTALALPFIAFAGTANLLFDRETAATLFGIGISGGLLSFAVLILKTVLTVSSALILAGTTPLNDLAAGLRRLRVPCVLVIQFMLTWRYLEVLMAEAMHTWRAYRLRSAGGAAVRFGDWPGLMGHLFLRSLDRAGRIYQAMQCRGFNVESAVNDERKATPAQMSAVALFLAACVLFRCFNVSQWIGNLLT